MEERDLRKVVETSYLTAENVGRYRTILRFFYDRHNHMQTYLYPEEVHAAVAAIPPYADYTQEELEQDLKALERWGNIRAHQETANANTIADFKKKRYRYQITPATVEIERMLEVLKKVGDNFGGSLEVTQFDRLLSQLRAFLTDYREMSDQELSQTFDDLMHYFRTMADNVRDYFAHLQSAKVEERMRMETFLAYKDTFTKYLREFVLGLQHVAERIVQLLRESTPEVEKMLFRRVAARKMIVHGMDENASAASFARDCAEDWRSMRIWFCGHDGRASDLSQLESRTKATIERIATFAERLANAHQTRTSRKADYLRLASMFAACPSDSEAHRLAAAVFGAGRMRHFYVHEPRQTDERDRRVIDEAPANVAIKPRTTAHRERIRQTSIRDYTAEKKRMREAFELRQKEQDAMLESLVVDGAITFADLPKITGKVRAALLMWLERCMAHDGGVRLPSGHRMRLDPGWREQDERICIHAEDGDFYMPPMRLLVERGDVHESR